MFTCKKIRAKNSSEIEITYSNVSNLVEKVEDSPNSGDPIMEVVYARVVPHDDSNAIIIKIRQTEVERKLKALDYPKNITVSRTHKPQNSRK